MPSIRTMPVAEIGATEHYDPEIVIVDKELHLLTKPEDVIKDCYISKKWLTRMLERLESTISAKAN